MSQSSPEVTIITPAFNRIEGLRAAIKSVSQQTFGSYEHLIIHDGPASKDWLDIARNYKPGHSRVVLELGQDTLKSGVCETKGVGPLLAGWLLARAPIVTYCFDDDEIYPEHCEVLYHLLEHSGADIAYSPRDTFVGGVWVGRHGSYPPIRGSIGFVDVMHRLSLVGLGHWENDWQVIKQWVEAGKKFAFLERPTHAFNQETACPT
jgi:glycosyltransferase involved in cell wall biosynthesis